MSPKCILCWTTATSLLAIAGAAIIYVGSYSPTTASAATLVSATSEDPTPLTANRLAQDLLDAGLSPEHMCVSGATVAQVTSAWNAAVLEAASVAVAMDQARAGIEAASKAVQSLERLVRRGQADPRHLNDLTAQRSLLANHTTARNALIASIRTKALTHLDADSRTKLERLNAPHVGLDAMYRVIDWNQADAVALREAIADVQLSIRRGREPSEASTRLVVDAESVAAVATAKQHKAARMASIEAAWHAMIRPE